MRHETFHDTTDLKKRKPNRLRGTPANKYSHALSFACVLGFTLGCHLFTRADWAQPYLTRFFEKTAPSVHQERQKWMINDPKMDTKSTRGGKEKNDKRVSSASEDSLNDFKTPPSTRASKLSDVKYSGFDSDNSPAVRSINSSFDNRPDENQPGPSNPKKPTKRPVSPPDDSLADFKSPKLGPKPTVKLLDKPINKTRSKKPNRKLNTNKKDSNQMSIESSFFKPTTSFPCPLCLKTFSDSTSQIAHSKTCASKNKVSTRKLLEAVALQERQAEERRAIGLPAQPFAQPRRKSTFRRSDFRSEDPNVQLALALSESLKEAQDLEELDAAIALTGEEILLSSSQRQNTLKNFGFLTNKQTVEVIERPKKKKLNSQTVLQTRTQETRQRLLAERIAEVIVDNSDTTWVNLEVQDELGEIKLISKVLKEILEPGRKLWNGSAGRKRGEFYYVKNLEGFIDPIDQNIDPGDDFFDKNKILELDFKEKISREFKNKKKDKKRFEEMENALESSKKILERSKSVLESAENCSFNSSEENLILNEKNSKEEIKNINSLNDEKNIEEISKKRKLIGENSHKTEEIKKDNFKILEDKEKIEESSKKFELTGEHFLENSLLESAGKNFSSFESSGENLILNKKEEIKRENLKILENKKIEKTSKKLKLTGENSLENNWLESAGKNLDCSFKFSKENLNLNQKNSPKKDEMKEENLKILENKKIEKTPKKLKLIKENSLTNNWLESIGGKNLDCSFKFSEENFVENSLILNEKNSKEEEINKEDKKKIEEISKKNVENSLSNSWRKMLNSSDLSDVIILCEDKFIYGHSVVFWTRCQFLYRDLVKIDQVNIKNLGSIDQFKYQINWRDIDFFTALVFLEFIYCGYIEDLKVEFDKLNLMVEKYKYDELSEYLKNCTDYNYCNNCKNNESIDEEVANFLSPGNFKSNNTNLTMSPDIFDDEDSICDNFGKIETKKDLSIDLNFLNEEVDKKEEIIDKNSKTLRRSSTCPDIEKIQSFSEDLNNTLKKTRSDLSVFIEKIQRRNARDILADSDDDSLLPEKETKKINKFKKVDQSLTDRYKNIDLNSCNINLRRGSRFWAAKKSIEKPEKVVKKSALSIFEDDIREKVSKDQLKNYEIESDEEIKDLSNLTQSFESNDLNISMYSKYKLTHKENSIAYYRNLIKESESEEEILNFSQKVSEQGLKSPAPSVGSNRQEFLDLCSPAPSIGSNIETEKDAILEDDKNLEENVSSQKSLLDIEFNENDFEDDDFVDEIIEKSFSLQKSVEFKGYSRFLNSDEVIDVDEKVSEGFKSPAPFVGSNDELEKNPIFKDDLVVKIDDKNLEKSKKSLLDIEFNENDFEDDDFVDKIIEKSFCLQNSFEFKGYSQSLNSDKVIDVDEEVSEGFKSPAPSVGSNRQQFSGLCSPAPSFGSSIEIEKDAILEDDKNLEKSVSSQKSLLEFNKNNFDDDDFVDEIIEKSFCLQKSVEFKGYNQSFNSDKVIDVDEDDKSKDSFKNQSFSKEKMRRISTTNQIYLQELSRYDLYKPEGNIDEESVLDLTLSDEEKEEDKSCKRQRSEDLVIESDEEMFSVKKKKNSTSLSLSQDIASQGKTITSNLTNILKECGVISPTPKSPILISDDSRDSFEFSRAIFEGGAEGSFVTSTQAPSSSSNLRLRRSTTVSPVKKKRLLINKSKSDFSFNLKNNEEINKGEINKKILNKEEINNEKINEEEINKKINEEEICNYLKLNKENVIVSLNIEPKIDYSLLSTPELNRKLNLYGLKNQKRHRAVKLLTYIYESLNPLIPEEIVQKKSGFFDKQEEYKWRIDSLLRTDDEDDNNKVSGEEKNDCESLSSELPEEMDLGDDEYDQRDLKSVKETFGILLGEDDDLHRKVLTYESLPLETLHGMIKDRGVKCSVRVLMDYLNEECIGFYVEAPKKWSNGRRKPKKLK
ncbi:hypothetical protein KQX54_003879 [Cotesia glomerata]|uniref:Structure-specific endonuclease subunit SLX4 n=1 Tax=Cotesia glomerata TaxID=32391 RepID=A0AAV7HVF2_COTGL|nr:hypothetical protein KQX54_003879 [Cotesia glomerata]